MNSRNWLRLQGTRYRCVPLYLPFEEFDPIARLFLEVLRYERSVPRLVRAFGLTERVVEDVLGDLIRRNRAALVIHRGVKEIRLLEDSLPNVVFERGETLDVWQEQATGIILPAWMIDPYDRPHVTEGTLKDGRMPLAINLGRPLVGDFINAPDSQLIEMIVRADDNLRRREETFGELDRLTDRYRVRPQVIWLPVVDAELQGQSIPLIATERIPPWVNRVWSVALRRDSFRRPAEVVEFHTEVTTDMEGFRIVHGWRASTRLDTWRGAVDRFLKLVPAPISGYDLREVREHEAALTGLFLSIGKLELIDPPRSGNDIDWLRPVFDVSRNWVILVLPWSGQIESLFEWLQQRDETDGEFPSSLILVLPSGTTDSNYLAKIRALLGPSRFTTMIRRDWPSTGPSFALGDGAEGRILYGPRSSLIRFASESFAAEWLGIVQALPGVTSDQVKTEAVYDEPLRELRVRRENLGETDAVCLGASDDARTVIAVIDDLRGFGESLLTAVVDPELLMRDSSPEQSEIPASGVFFDKERSLFQQLPILSERCDELSYHLSLSPSPPGVLWTHLTSHELTPTLVGVLTEPARRSIAGEIHILASGTSEETLSVMGLLEKAVIHYGWILHIGLPKEDRSAFSQPSDEILASVRAEIASPRLRLWKLRRPPPAHALIIDDLVFVSGGDWLRPTLDQQFGGTDFGFAIESREFAESLRACFTGAEEAFSYKLGS